MNFNIDKEKFQKLSKRKQYKLYEAINLKIADLLHKADMDEHIVETLEVVGLQKMRDNYEEWSCYEVVEDENW